MTATPGTLLAADWHVEVTTDTAPLLLTGIYAADVPTWSRPAPRAPRSTRPFDAGADVSGADYGESRPLTVSVLIRDQADPTAAVAALDALVAAWTPMADGVGTLAYRRLGGDRFVYGRPGRIAVNEDTLRYGIARVTLEWDAIDPREYSTTLRTQAFDASGPVGGAAWPAPWPTVWTTTADPSEVDLTNGGGVPTPILWHITGPCSRPRLEHVASGAFLEFALDLLAGQTLTVDVANRTVQLGAVGRAATKTPRSTWWHLPAGTSAVRFRSFDEAGTAVASWRDAR